MPPLYYNPNSSANRLMATVKPSPASRAANATRATMQALAPNPTPQAPAPAPRPAPRPTAAPVAAPVPVAAPTPAPAPTTPAAVYGPDLGTYNPTDAYDAALAARIRDTGLQGSTAVNEKQIYRDKLNNYQKEIDAVNQIYRETLRVENIAGQGR